MQHRVAGYDVAGILPGFAAIHVADIAACFPDEQGAGGDVPNFQAVFPETVQAVTLVSSLKMLM